MSAPSGTWDAAFEAVPVGSSSIGLGDDAIRALKNAISTRIGREHYGLTADTNSMHGWHKAGSAVAFAGAAAPAVKPEASGAVLDNYDQGRLWFRTTDGNLLVWVQATATAAGLWVGCIRELARASIQGTLAVGSNILPAIVFPRACTILKVNAAAGTSPVGASLIVDLIKHGAGSIFSGVTPITITSGHSTDSRVVFHATNGVLAADDYLLVNITQIGSTTPGSDLSLTIEVRLD